MATVKLFGLLRKVLGVERFETTAATVGAALAEGRARFGEPFAAEVFGPDGALSPGVILLVDGRNVHFLQGLATPLDARAEVHLFPPSAGG